MSFHFLSRLATLLAAGVLSGLASSLRAHAQPTTSQAPRFSRILVFGDSLCDVGNVAARTGSAFGVRFPGPFFNLADGRFTNSAATNPKSSKYVGVWHEQLAAALGLPPATPSEGGGLSFAFGGATTSGGAAIQDVLGSQFAIDNMGLQVDAFLRRSAPEPDALAILWGGANDLLQDPRSAPLAAQQVAALVEKLARAGARNFLVLNVPPLGDTPRGRGAAGESTALNAASAQFRAALNVALDRAQANLSASNAPITIYRLDIFELFSRVARDPAAFGFANARDHSQGEPGEPDGYLFWDNLHPTTAGHHQIALAAQALLQGPSAPRPALSLSPSRTTFGENAGAQAATLTITRSGPTTNALAVSLASGDASEARPPTSVTIAAGACSATVPVAAIDDAVADGTQHVSKAPARAGAFKSASVALAVLDNEIAALRLKLTPARIREGGARALLTITRNIEITAASPALPVALSASVAGQIMLPARVVIPARAASVSVSVVATNDEISDGPRRVSILARASGLASASQALTAEDDEAASRFAISGRVLSAPARPGGVLAGVPQVLVTLRVGATLCDEVLSDGTGNFRFSNLPAASHSVAVSKVGVIFPSSIRGVRVTDASVAGVIFMDLPRP